MAIAVQQIDPIAPLPLVLGVVRRLEVATVLDRLIPPHPAHVLSCGRGVEALVLAILPISGIYKKLLDALDVIALHLTVVQLTCNENGDPDILLLARFHAQPGGAYHGSHDGILPQ